MSEASARHPDLLVSVRSADEAIDALAGGADLIDVKEPQHGSLGAADYGVIAEVISAVADRVPVSAALGELAAWNGVGPPAGVAFVKWGLSNLGTQLMSAVSGAREWKGVGQPVLVAYADYRRAHSPEPGVLARLACQLRFPAFLIDTAIKDGTTLLDWIGPRALARLRSDLSAAGVRVALAGSLGLPEIRRMTGLAPDWFAVRGAACEGGRSGRISSQRVREIKDLIAAARTPSRAN